MKQKQLLTKVGIQRMHASVNAINYSMVSRYCFGILDDLLRGFSDRITVNTTKDISLSTRTYGV